MNPVTINTILDSAPVIIRAAGKLIKLIKDREQQAPDEYSAEPVTNDNLKMAISKIESRLDATDESNVEQIKLIEQLARQNEMLAESLQRMLKRFTVAFILALTALLIAIVALLVR